MNWADKKDRVPDVPLQMAVVEMASCFPDLPECMVWEASSPRLRW